MKHVKYLVVFLLGFSVSLNSREKAIGRFRNLNVANNIKAKSITVNNLNVEGSISLGSQVVPNIVSGPTSSVPNSVPIFANTTGRVLASSPVLIDGSGNVTLNGITKNGTTLSWPLADASAGQFLGTNGNGQLIFDTPQGAGNVTSVNIFTADNALIRVDLPSGARNIQQSGVIVDDSNNLSGVQNLFAVSATVSTFIQTGGGTIANPAIRIANATTGLSSATQHLSFTTSSAERLKISSSGTISINEFTLPGVVHNDALGNLSSSTIVNADIALNAAIADVKLATIATGGKVANSATTATPLSVKDAIVTRDANKNFSANIITANTFNGIFSGAGNFTSITNSGSTTLTALNSSQAVVTDGSKNLASLLYATTNTASSLVERDASGNFAAGTIMANLTGDVTGNVIGNVTGSVNLNGGTISDGSATFTAITDSGLTANQAVVTDGSKNLASLPYATANTPSSLVERDASGNFAAGTITANLTGNVTGNVNLNGGTITNGSATFTSITDTGLTASQAVVTDGSKNLASLPYATANTPNSLVERDGSGNFAAGTITANLTGSVNLNGGTISNGSATFTSITDSSLTPSEAVVTNGSNQLVSLAYTSNATANTIALRDANGRLQVQDPSANLDAATKEYVDAIASGLKIKDPVIAVSISNIVFADPNNPSGLVTVDGVALLAGDRVLLTAQNLDTPAGVTNGIWVVQDAISNPPSGDWTRPTDFANGSHASGSFVFVQQGTTYHETQWVDTNSPLSDTVGTDPLTWVEFSAVGQVTAQNVGTGAGVFRDKTGTTLNFRSLNTSDANFSITQNANDNANSI